MKRSNIIGIIAAAVVIIVSVVLISWYLRRSTPTLIQGTVRRPGWSWRARPTSA